MILIYSNQLLALSLLLFSTLLFGQQPSKETNLSDAIKIHQSAKIPEPFSIQHATTKVKIKHIQLSPNGENLYFITRKDNGVVLHIYNIESEKSKTLFHSNVLNRAHWSTDGKILFLQSTDYLAYIDPFAENAKAHIFHRFNHENEEQFYGVDRSQSQQVLINRKMNTQHDGKPYQLLRINTLGDQQLIFSDKSKIYDYLFDASGQLAFIRQPGKEQHNIFQITGKEKKLVFNCQTIDKCQLIQFKQSTKELSILGLADFNFRSLFSFNLNTKAIELIHQDPEQIADLISINTDPSTGEVTQLDYLSDRMRHYSLNEDLNADYQWLESQLPGNLYISSRKTGENWLVMQTNAQLHHHKYYIYNFKEKQLKPILDNHRLSGNPISPAQLAANIPVSYTASDGMLLHGYVMLPAGRKLSEVPLVASIHGGPFNRVKGGYSPVQYLVNQGYAVFQPNFRASTGYGLQYLLAGKEKFSTRVQQDIVDGFEYLLAQGVGDREKLGVFGHSFGGYSVLSLMSSYPDLFKAGIATAPGTDLLELLQTLDKKGINEYDGVPLRFALPVLFADMENPVVVEQMRKTSPRNNGNKITKPLLIWGGGKDERIPITHLREFALKLRQSGQTIEFIEDKYTGHNPSPNDSITPKSMLFLVAAFLNKHIKNVETESDTDISTYIKKHRVY
ncbi:alpha/beta hydrolase family protein [Marinicella rhabdoformis]|uniref:alpha/beta hydrolase family protein n=1 Tax=Marinicella rhabdoformis TaxID=2580566 RepID=UPI0015D08504|nr:prolyl oligopeptidase family serine peptidase [Marinicella rhabdoformis]